MPKTIGQVKVDIAAKTIALLLREHGLECDCDPDEMAEVMARAVVKRLSAVEVTIAHIIGHVDAP